VAPPPGFNRSFGMILLGIWLILTGLSGIALVALPPYVLPFLAVIAGALIMLGE
jgi:hypothetical protein